MSEAVIMLKGGLSSFNMVAAANMVALGKAGSITVNKNSTLKAVILVGTEFCMVVFHCQPIDPNLRSGSWLEKTFFDAVHAGTAWVYTNINAAPGDNTAITVNP